MGALSAIGDVTHAVRVLGGAGLLGSRQLGLLGALNRASKRWGFSLAAGYAALAERRPDAVGVIDERGPGTYADIHRRSDAIAAALADDGHAGRPIGILCRDHRGFVEAAVAVAKVGADTVLLNTGFAAPQLADVVAAEGITAVIHDQEFDGIAAGLPDAVDRYVAWVDGAGAPGAAPPEVDGTPTLDGLVARRLPGPERAERTGRLVVLTSGTTGRPKGAARSATTRSVGPAVALLSAIPLRSGETTVIAAPLFHSWGLAHLSLGTLLGSTIVVRRRFDPEETLAAVARHRATALAVVPVMLQRILDLPPEVRQRHDTSSLRVVAASGSALTGSLATRFMDAFGDVLYNLYGSTEVSWATIAGPDDLRAAPGTAGRPPRGTVVRIYDQDGHSVPTGGTGRIFVGNEFQFEGYTGGGGKASIDGLLDTGDVGHFTEDGLLFVEGRSDDMIVSGGENVFPAEVEDLLANHPGVADVAVIGVADEEFGQRLRAFVVPALGSGGAPTEEELKEHVRRHLARHKVPRDVHFVDELPRNQTGKVVRRELPGD